MPAGITFAGVKTRAEGARVISKVGYKPHPMIEHFRFVKDHARPGIVPKITIPAPSALFGRIGRSAISRAAYPNIDEFFADLGKAYAQAVRAFANAGCRYLQLDEVYIAMLCDDNYRAQVRARGEDPDRLGVVYADMVNAAMADIPADMTVTMHLCRGNYRSTWQGAGAYDKVQEILFNRVKIYGLFMEYDDERSGGFEPLAKLPKDKTVVLGIMTAKRGELETKDQLKLRIEEAAKYTDLDRLCISGQCGFALPRRATRCRRMSSGLNSGGWWRWRTKCGTKRHVTESTSALHAPNSC